MNYTNRYNPPEGSIVEIIFAHTEFDSLRKIAKFLGTDGESVKRWNENESFPLWGLLRLGFNVDLDHTMTLSTLKSLRFQINRMIEDIEE